MFALPAVTISAKHRASAAHFVSEVIATPAAGDLRWPGPAAPGPPRRRSAPTSAPRTSFTSSTSFANPAITIGRMFSDTFAGIAPSSVPSFIAAQILGGILAAGVIKTLHPDVTPADAAEIIVPRHGGAGRAPASAVRRNASLPVGGSPGPASRTGPQEGALPCTWW